MPDVSELDGLTGRGGDKARISEYELDRNACVIADLIGQFGYHHFKEVHTSHENCLCIVFIPKYLFAVRDLEIMCTLHHPLWSCKSLIVNIVVVKDVFISDKKN